MKYGIKFPSSEVQFGKSVHFLDLCVYLDSDNSIQYRGYTKPTDAKRYLNPKSFHPQSVFNAIPFSQMLRSLRNNSKEETRTTELNQCIKNFENSGYSTGKLNELKEKAIQKASTTNNETSNEEVDTLVFPVHYFNGLPELKKLIKELSNEFKKLIGNTRIIMAAKKCSSIGNMFVRNKPLSISNSVTSDNQRCNARSCRQCPLTNEKSKMLINNNVVRIPRYLNCKSNNVIYLWLCKLCNEREAYFGRTTQECHKRSNGHRGCFTEE